MTVLPFALDRTVVIRATPDVVFSFFTSSERWAAWWGAGSAIDPRPGGRLSIRYPNGAEAAGEVVIVEPPRRIVFTMGYPANPALPPGASRVTLTLEPHRDGTRLQLTHELPDAATRDQHVQGWRYQLAVFSNVVADATAADAAATVDAWFAAWGETDADARRAALARVAAPGVRFRDRHSQVDGLDDLVPHIGAAQRFMPGVVPARDGGVRHCQGVVLADWIVRAPDGAPAMRGTNVFTLGPDGRIADVTGVLG